ncbi:MAG: histidine--tRNA ligase [Deltaproteobacteria bacterium]|jgi:histidyl-tRNA synthetase|nr:histidine--tRNA ligase [Deltaproteobacteria bacterium]
MSLPPTAVRGFKDILPEQARLFRFIEETARVVAERFNYQELCPPILEKTELFTRGIGEDTDIVEKEMYTIVEGSADSLSLRPEATAGMVRALIENNLAQGGKIAKFFCLGPMFRRERPQKGRLRQFHQLDVEVFGTPGPYIDAEVIDFLHTFLTKLGLNDLSVVLNSLGCPDCRPLFRKALSAFLEQKRPALCLDCQRRLERNPLRILDCKNPSCCALTLQAPSLSSFRCLKCQEHFDGLQDSLKALNINFVVDDKLVRGLDYYTRTAFEVQSGQLGAQNAAAGGGRYDGLCLKLGGPDIPAIGFASGLERLAMLIEQSNQSFLLAPPSPDYYIALLVQEALAPAMILVQKLRALGQKISCDWEVGSLKSRLRQADKAKASKILILGPDELAQGLATVRDLNTKEQVCIPINQPDLF